MTTQALCDSIRRNMSREELEAALEAAGFAVRDEESDQELIEALAEHYETEGITPAF